jgi:hypothetical protein
MGGVIMDMDRAGAGSLLSSGVGASPGSFEAVGIRGTPYQIPGIDFPTFAL